MFRRLTNLWRLSKYRVEDLSEETVHGRKQRAANLVLDAKPKKKKAQIIQLDYYDPLNEFTTNETPEQPRKD